MFRPTAFLFLALCMILSGATSARAQFDKVFDNTGKPATGAIIEITNQAVTVQGTGVRKVGVNEIKRVVFGDEPTDLTDARDACYRGAYDECLSQLNDIDLTSVTRAEIKQDIAFLRAFATAHAALRGGSADERTAAYNGLAGYLKNDGGQNSFHYYEVVEAMGQLSAASGDYAKAGQIFSQFSKSEWPEFKMKGAVLEAQALIAQAKFPEALAKYEIILSAVQNTPEALKQKQMATIGRAVCLAGTGKPADGITLLDEIIAKNDSTKDPALFARAYNGLGFCYVKANKPKEALMAYLHTDTLFAQDPDAHAEALYYLAKLWKLDNKGDRALRAQNTLQQRYAGSMWETRK